MVYKQLVPRSGWQQRRRRQESSSEATEEEKQTNGKKNQLPQSFLFVSPQYTGFQSSASPPPPPLLVCPPAERIQHINQKNLKMLASGWWYDSWCRMNCFASFFFSSLFLCVHKMGRRRRYMFGLMRHIGRGGNNNKFSSWTRRSNGDPGRFCQPVRHPVTDSNSLEVTWHFAAHFVMRARFGIDTTGDFPRKDGHNRMDLPSRNIHTQWVKKVFSFALLEMSFHTFGRQREWYNSWEGSGRWHESSTTAVYLNEDRFSALIIDQMFSQTPQQDDKYMTRYCHFGDDKYDR